jgi:hypothetical protein
MSAPRLPREPVALLRTALVYVVCLLAIGFIAWLFFWWNLFHRLIGWVFE